DGVDMAPVLFGNGKSQRDVWFYYRGTQLYAVRKGDFKAHFITKPAYGPGEAQRHDPPVLYNLAHDPGEQFDVAKEHPDVIAAIAAEVEKHRATVTPVKNQLEEIVKAN
ncbi:MAG: arylsulfatase, partial [Verrucomicrobia bacterium]|nr:arylsulfatase [Verrucomicrobiota bacterium]